LDIPYRSKDPRIHDNAWYCNPSGRRLRRVTAESLSPQGPLQ
jgi:hypothetical protein